MSTQLATKALHAGHDSANSQGTQAVPIYQTTSYVFKDSWANWRGSITIYECYSSNY